MINGKSIAAFYCVFDDDEWLQYSLTSIYPAVDAIYFLVANKPWNGPSTDNCTTINCITQFPDVDRKIHLLRADWANEVDQRNWAINLIKDEGHDYAFIVDADEIYDTGNLVNMFGHAVSHPEVTCWHCWFIHYWKSHKFRIDPPENHHPPILLKSGSGLFVEYRNCRSIKHELIPAEVGFCHHMSYARTDQQIYRKITSFSHSHQISPDWFEKKWKAWETDQTITDLCPYNPGVFHSAVPVPNWALPKVLAHLD